MADKLKLQENRTIEPLLITIKNEWQGNIKLDISKHEHLILEVNPNFQHLNTVEAATLRNAISRWLNNCRHNERSKEKRNVSETK